MRAEILLLMCTPCISHCCCMMSLFVCGQSSEQAEEVRQAQANFLFGRGEMIDAARSYAATKVPFEEVRAANCLDCMLRNIAIFWVSLCLLLRLMVPCKWFFVESVCAVVCI
jgi:hypothetical protein